MNRWLEKTVAYLESEHGRKNWKANTDRGYSYEMNLVAAVQTATHLITYKRIIEVLSAIKVRWAPARGWAA